MKALGADGFYAGEGRGLSLTLGYVFWHWPRRWASGQAYEGKLAEFHRSLRSHPSEGMLESLSFSEPRRPWRSARGKAYEDWYLVTDYLALGALNAAAVAGALRKPHDEIAADALGGAGGLYLLLRGGLELKRARFATWVSKPPRTSYQAFLGRLSELAEDDTDVWQRQMALGPAAEFCIHSREPIGLPASFRHQSIPIRLVGERGS